MILISACLLGENCTYKGSNNYDPDIIKWLKDREYLAICPEVLGGLSTPRLPAEIQKGTGNEVLKGTARVVNQRGKDLTAPFLSGAKAALELAINKDAQLVILKENSPSCGVKKIYDGSFSKQKINGQGVTAALLIQNGFKVCSEKNLKKQGLY
ncbi:MAG: DUF523 domain-containing protein [Bacillota bacterium]|jgi:uncharacterized protein YbbK (DUF523 family)